MKCKVSSFHSWTFVNNWIVNGSVKIWRLETFTVADITLIST